MASCAACNTTILFGGKKAGDLRFCSDRCLQRGAILSQASQVPAALVEQETWLVHQGNCPKCNGRGPIDVRNSYRVWSALVLTQWMTRPNLCCQACGTSNRLKDIGFCLLFGWWGFPWGLIMTPVQVFRNLAAIFSASDPSKPSPQLSMLVTLQLASRRAAQAGTAISKDEASLWADKKMGHV